MTSPLSLHRQQSIDMARTMRDRVEFVTHSRRSMISPEQYALWDTALWCVDCLAPKHFVSSADDIEIAWVDRERYHADVTIRIPWLIREHSMPTYIREIVPVIADTLRQAAHEDITGIMTVGMYVNISLSDEWLYNMLDSVCRLGDQYGRVDLHRGESAIVDYSSPNIAKLLHAGHIRSTILGHIIANLLDMVGFATHRISYINDWGGMGAILEGYRRWHTEIESAHPEYTKNQVLAEIYGIFRAGEKLSVSTLPPSEKDEAFLKKYFPNKGFSDFKQASVETFATLEKGENAEIVNLWENIIVWSLTDFRVFYDLLGIPMLYQDESAEDVQDPSQCLVAIGESPQAGCGLDLVKQYQRDGKILFFDSVDNGEVVKAQDAVKEDATLTEKQKSKLLEEISRDYGSYVVPLKNHERYVILKGSEATIYATRDIATLAFRMETYQPSRIVYEVGQEQADHFNKLFESGRTLGIVPEGIELTHVYHGFYVDESGKKLSSRDGASDIVSLITRSIEYFRMRYRDSTDFTESEKDHIARSLAVGSIVYNDIKKDKKSSVTMGKDFEAMMKGFEESGGAYIVYTACRAKSILRKYGKPVPSAWSFYVSTLDPREVALVKKILGYPDVIVRAAEQYSPTIVAEYLFELAQAYNSYYAVAPVLMSEETLYRLVITQAVAQTLDNGLRVCHITPLDRI